VEPLGPFPFDELIVRMTALETAIEAHTLVESGKALVKVVMEGCGVDDKSFTRLRVFTLFDYI
jgi:hypothetical protein